MKTIKINADTITAETEAYLHETHTPDVWFIDGMVGAIERHIADAINYDEDTDYRPQDVFGGWAVEKILKHRWGKISPSKDYHITIHNMLNKIELDTATDDCGHIWIKHVTLK